MLARSKSSTRKSLVGITVNWCNGTTSSTGSTGGTGGGRSPGPVTAAGGPGQLELKGLGA